MTRAEILRQAETWIGTPWKHQARLKGVGADCVGFVYGVYKAVGGVPVAEPPTDYPASWHVWNKEERLYKEAVKSGLVEKSVSELRPGDVILFRIGTMAASHLGIMAENGLFLHSFQTMARVQPSTLEGAWRRRIAYVFEFPEVSD